VRVLLENRAAFAFWQRAVAGVVGSGFTQCIEPDEDLNMHFLRFKAEAA
jgi:hypothetical protein